MPFELQVLSQKSFTALMNIPAVEIVLFASTAYNAIVYVVLLVFVMCESAYVCVHMYVYMQVSIYQGSH